MRTFANLFLILFLADGVISLGDELVALIFPLTVFSDGRNAMAAAVMVMAALVYLCLGIDRRLPKRLFLPPIIFVFWCPLSTWFFPALDGNRVYGLLVAAAQVFLGLLPFTRPGHRGRLPMTREMFTPPFFSIRNTLLCTAANIVIIPCGLLLFALLMANSYMKEYTSGFARLAPDGLHMADRTYRRGARTVRLAGMIHVGEKGYYDDLIASVPSGRTLILAEGVSDEENRLLNRLDYGKVAGALGLTSQASMRFKGRAIAEEELDRAPSRDRERGTDILRADVDVSSFRPPTIRFIEALGREMKESSSLLEGVVSFNRWAEKNMTPEMHQVIMDDILYRRNGEVIRHLKKALDRYDTVIIPWGALHMAGIEHEVLALGFHPQEERDRISISFRAFLPGSGTVNRNAGRGGGEP